MIFFLTQRMQILTSMLCMYWFCYAMYIVLIITMENRMESHMFTGPIRPTALPGDGTTFLSFLVMLSTMGSVFACRRKY
jgi:hypothetical protein